MKFSFTTVPSNAQPERTLPPRTARKAKRRCCQDQFEKILMSFVFWIVKICEGWEGLDLSIKLSSTVCCGLSAWFNVLRLHRAKVSPLAMACRHLLRREFTACWFS